MKENFEVENEIKNFNSQEVEQRLDSNDNPETSNECLDEIQDKEIQMFKKAEEALEGLTLKEFKSKPAAALLAFSILTNASSVFANSSEDNDFNLPDFSYDNVSSGVVKKEQNNISSFFSMFFKKFEFSYSEQSRYLSDNPSDILTFDRNGAIGVAQLKEGIFSSDMFTYRNRMESITLFSELLRSSNNSEEFFENLENLSSELTDEQKLAFLQNSGRTLGFTYNYDMLENDIYVQVSDEKMFSAMKRYQLKGELEETGICGNIHTFQTRVATALGLPSWLESGSRKDIGHVVSGIVASVNGGEQIIFNDYGRVVLTDTLDYSKALGVLERHLGRVGTFNTFVASDTSVLFPVKSEAQEVVEYASGMRKTETRLKKELISGKIKSEDGIKINITPEFKEVSIDNGYVGLSHFKFEDVNDSPYQAIDTMEASRFTARFKGEHLGVEANVTFLNMTLKDLYEGNIDLREVVTRLAADYINSQSLTKKEYGEFLLSYGATLQAAIRRPLDKYNEGAVSAMAESGIGANLTYIPKGSSGKFYIGASEVFRGQVDNFQDQEAVLKEAERIFTVGGSFRAQEATVSLEAKKTDTDWGDSLRLSSTLQKGKLKTGLYYQEENSDYEKFIPSKKEFGAGVSYKSGPKWQVDIFGAKEIRQYDGSKKNSYNTEIKFKIFLW